MVNRSSPELKWRVVAYVMDGTGAYLVAVVLLLVAGWFFARAFHPQERARKEFHRLLTARSEPYRGEEYQVAGTAVTSELATGFDPGCPDPEELTILADLRKALENLLSGVPRCLAGTTQAPDRAVPWLPISTVSFGLELRRPSACNTSVVATETALDSFAAAAAFVAANRARTVTPHVLKYFFISANGVTLAPRETLVPVRGTHPLQAANYVREVLERKEADLLSCRGAGVYVSSPYLDITGDGLVQTVCLPVAGKNRGMVGAVCADRAPDADRVRATWSRLQPLFDAKSVIIGKGAGIDVEPCTLPSDCRAGTADEALVATVKTRLKRNEDFADEDPEKLRVRDASTWLLPPEDGGRDGSSSSLLLVPVRRIATKGSNAADKFEAIVLKPRVSDVIELGQLMLGLCALIAAGAVVFYSSARQRERERLRVLHGLPMPVVVTRGMRRQPTGGWRARAALALVRRLGFTQSFDDHSSDDSDFDVILFANAAAESLLDEKLPRFPRATRAMFLVRGVEALRVHRLADWFEGNDRERYLQNTKKREFESVSSYNLRLKRGKHRGHRIRLTGSRLRRANGDIDTFGILEDLSAPKESQ